MDVFDRSLTSDMLAELDASSLVPAFFVEIETLSEVLHIWSGIGDFDWNGFTWSGVGALGSISNIPETRETQAQGLKLTLTGIPTDLIGEALSQMVPKRSCKVWFGLFTSSGVLVPNPYESFGGRTDLIQGQEGGSTSTIIVSVESRLIDLQNPRLRTYTDNDQQMQFPGDVGFQRVPEIQNKTIVWGKNVNPA